MGHVYFYKQISDNVLSSALEHFNILINIFCGCHCSVALLNSGFVCVSVTRWASWLNPLFLYVHVFIPVFICCQWSCRHCGLLSVYKVNSCFMSNKVYYINSFREFGNDIACCKLDVVTGLSIRMTLNKWRHVKDKLSGNVSLAAASRFLLLWLCHSFVSGKNWCWLNSANLDKTPTIDSKMFLCCYHFS